VRSERVRVAIDVVEVNLICDGYMTTSRRINNIDTAGRIGDCVETHDVVVENYFHSSDEIGYLISIHTRIA
jgi:hypothetical protein